MVKQLNDQQSELIQMKEHARQLEAKLLEMEQKKSVPANIVLDATSISVELEPWYENINKIYAELKDAMEHYYTMASKEKVLHFRTELKQHAEDAKRTLVLDGYDIKRVS